MMFEIRRGSGGMTWFGLAEDRSTWCSFVVKMVIPQVT
jgi:hypothetical protein